MSDGQQPADLPLPENAITAAAETAARMLGHQLVRYHYDVARTVLTAAAPVLRAQGGAAERERLAGIIDQRYPGALDGKWGGIARLLRLLLAGDAP